MGWGRGWGEDFISISSPTKMCLKVEVLCLLIILPSTYLQAKICWNKQNTLHPQIKIWHLGVLTMQIFVNIALKRNVQFWIMVLKRLGKCNLFECLLTIMYINHVLIVTFYSNIIFDYIVLYNSVFLNWNFT